MLDHDTSQYRHVLLRDLSSFLELLRVEAEQSHDGWIKAEVVAWHKVHSFDHIVELSQNLLTAVHALLSRALEEVGPLLGPLHVCFDASLRVIHSIQM